jgi:hypothetical protein
MAPPQLSRYDLLSRSELPASNGALLARHGSWCLAFAAWHGVARVAMDRLHKTGHSAIRHMGRVAFVRERPLLA